MNTYNKINLKELRSRLTNKNGKISARGRDALDDVYTLLIGRPIYTHEKTGSGRHTRQRELLSLYEFESIIYYLGLKVIYDNDAPRGGVLGNHYLIKRKRSKQQAHKIMNTLKDKLEIK